MSPLSLDSTQLVQMTRCELTITRFTAHLMEVILLIFSTLITTISTTGAPHWTPIVVWFAMSKCSYKALVWKETKLVV